MAAFRKAKPRQQAALKVAMFGAPGSGKTFTALLYGEGLAKHTGKRIAFVDTEHGTDFYAQEVRERGVHPEAFDFDTLYSKSLAEISKAVRALDPNEYGVVIIDSITHLWEAARDGYRGKRTRHGGIPINAWSSIKKPYKDLVNYLINAPFHVLLLGRQGLDMKEDDDTGENKVVGVKMKAEGETPYEPSLLLHFEAIKHGKRKESTITCFAEKDRSGILTGKLIEWPTFENTLAPILALLGDKQAHVDSQDEAAAKDAEAFEEAERAKATGSARLLEQFSARLTLADSADAVKAIGKEITAKLKSQMTTADVSTLRSRYLEALESKEKGVPE